jgi:hypothetical protein
MNPDAALPQAVGVDPGGPAVFLDQPPGRLAVEVSPLKSFAIGRERAEERPFLVLADAGLRHVGEQGSRRVE